jgi:quercetin dioxygenase-like cupin family protein
MRYSILFTLVMGLVGCQSAEMAMPDTQQMWHTLLTPEQVKWEPGPPSLPPGAKVAVLEGDPAKPGFFTMRAVVPDGYVIPPHSHPNPERITVLAGMMMLGQGDQFDEAKLQPMPVGTYSSMSAGMHHFAKFKGDSMIQITTIGPWGITYVNPADDPRNSGSK